ncbi:hypothetical protein JCM12298_20140 [Desulfothermus naphthae]
MRRLYVIILLLIVSFMLGNLKAISAEEKKQVIKLLPQSQEVGKGKNITLNIQYDVTDGNNALTGIGFKVFFNSNQIEFTGFSDVYSTSLIAKQEPQNDTNNIDNDPNTDKFVNIAWADITGKWPNGNLPLILAKLNFKTTNNFTQTKVNVVKTDTASGYDFKGYSATIKLKDEAGPTVSNLNALEIKEGTKDIELTALISDKDTGNNSISAAEYFINQKGQNGKGISMTAADGKFDSVTENVKAQVDTSKWTADKSPYTIYVHGKDSRGNWGDFAQIQVTVYKAPEAPQTTEIKSPTNNQTPTFDWADVANAAKYKIQIATDQNFQNIVSQKNDLTKSEYTPDTKLNQGTYYWRVKAVDAQGHEGAWSDVGSFVVDITPPTVKITSNFQAPVHQSSVTVAGKMEKGVTISAQVDTAAKVGKITYPSNTTWKFEITDLEKDANNITVIATDKAGNTATVQATIVYHPPISVNPSGEVYVPSTVEGFKQQFSIQGGSGSYTCQLSTQDYGNLQKKDESTYIFTPLKDKVGDLTLIIKDNNYNDLNPVKVTIHVVKFGLNPPNGGVEIGGKLNLEAVGTVGSINWKVENEAIGAIENITGDKKEKAVFIGKKKGTTKVTITDTKTGASVSGSFEVVEPIKVTAKDNVKGISDQDKLQFNAVGGKGKKNSDYVWMVDPASAGTIDENGSFTPKDVEQPVEVTITAADKTYNNVKGTYKITVVNPVTITNLPANNALETNHKWQFKSQGGSGTVKWSVDAGSIDKDGNFTAPTVNQGKKEVTITATDAKFNNIKASIKITVYAPIGIAQVPKEYKDGDPSTYPLINKTYTLSAVDPNRVYNWTISDWNGNVIDEWSGVNSIEIMPKRFFEKGCKAGIYTVKILDMNNPNLKPGSLKIRIPMKFVSEKFQADRGIYDLSTTKKDIYTVLGGPREDIYIYKVVDLKGKPFKGVGQFEDQSPTDNDNEFNFADNLNSVVSYKIKVNLDKDQYNNPDVKRLIDAGLGTVCSGIFRIVPMVQYSGTVVDENGNPIEGAEVRSVDFPEKSIKTDKDGKFTLTGFPKLGFTFKFIVSKDGYKIKQVTSDEIKEKEVVLEKLADGSGSISGKITLSDNGKPEGVAIQVKADGEYIKDSSGNIITVYTDKNGNYTFLVPADYVEATFTVEAKKKGYIFDENAGLGVVDNVVLKGNPPAATNVDLTLKPVTIIYVEPEAKDIDQDGKPDQVLVKITAKAGCDAQGCKQNQFDGTISEIKVTDNNGDNVPLDIFGANGANTWSFTHNKYGNFTVTIYADVSEDRDVDEGYFAKRIWTYHKSINLKVQAIDDPNIKGADATASSGENRVVIPPDGLRKVHKRVFVEIAEIDPDEVGAKKIVGSKIVEVKVKDENDQELSKDEFQRIEITLHFDPDTVTNGSLEAGTYKIYQADSVDDLVAGKGTPIPVDHLILPVDYTNGYVTFWVEHLSAFGIGGEETTEDTSKVSGDGGGGDNCFIATAAYGSLLEPHVKILRQFRDVYLLPNSLGTAFVKTYYKYSPPIAQFIAQHEVLRAAVRVSLLPLVGFSYLMLHTTATQKVILLLLSVVAVMSLFIRGRLRINKAK